MPQRCREKQHTLCIIKLNGPFAIVVLQITRQYANFKEIYTPVIEPWLKILSNALLFEEMHDWGELAKLGRPVAEVHVSVGKAKQKRRDSRTSSG